ncbi:cell division protein ZapE [Nocardia alba]|uniref:Cell division protein ZapE n=1 Tax=Nocardia alba TaxID=225051 RepID=A0A4R1GAJ5_9NOCA|nr:cell division protein ZapE [Nocardia alba]TCK01212.1 cell division protein ZapE [Nocardia alba]
MKPDTVVLDPAQQAALDALEALLDPVDGRLSPGGHSARRTGPFGIPRLAESGGRRSRALRGRRAARGNQPGGSVERDALRRYRAGIYLHGRPGRGKTMVMDRFYGAVRTSRKRRFHFHTFFAALHAATHALGSVERAIDELLGGADLVCFDEFHVTDIGDAMLIARLLEVLFAEHRTLVVTSNYRPRDLLPNPLFHDAFVPTIELILAHLDTVALDGPLDYRTRTPHRDTGFLAGRYVLTEGAGSAPPRVEAGARAVAARADPHDIERLAVDVPLGNGRTLRARTATDVITVDFHDICAVPTSAADYLLLAERYRHLTMGEVPPLREVPPDWAMRLVNLVDVVYDADIPFTIHASEPPHDLTAGVPLIPDLARTASRLGELPLTNASSVRAV